ncbi:MAG: DUF3826 domain-containing protein [Bacteroidales bacterium]|nr:DUF3826 domain-containing protein [Bacteroidales bacterium]
MKNKKNLLVALLLLILTSAEAQPIKVGVCDWMILKRQKLGEFSLANRLGADGVEMDMGGLGNNPQFKNKLRDDEASVREFNKAADSLKVEIGAIAMSGFYGQSFATKETYKELIEDCLNTMDKMGGVKVAFLPLGGCGNGWTDDKALRKTIVKRLHEVGEMAKQRGKVIGIDTPLDAAGNLKLLKEIKSDGIRIFYKWQTAVENGFDICADIKKLGAKNIAAFHASSIDSVCLRNDNKIDVPAIINTLNKMKWNGWFFVERSRDVARVKDVKYNYSNNVHYLKSLLGTLAAPEVALDSVGRDAQYVANILKRAQKVTDKLGITYQPKGQNVLNIVANRYFELNDIYAERDTLKKKDKKLAQATADSKLYRSHFGFDAKLSMYLNTKDIETVKDVMTFNVLHVTYEAHCDMIPTLTDEEKAQIMAWLIEARELAIDAESSNKKHEVFGKYKGRINNYLSGRGYDLVKEREAWYERIKARGGTI